MVDKNYVLSRLQAGETVQTIGDDFAKVMNDAIADFNEIQKKEAEAKAAAERESKDEAKRELAMEFVGTLQKYADLCGVDPELLGEIVDDELDQLVEAMDQMMELMLAVSDLKKKLTTAAPVAELKHSPIMPVPKASDDEILKSFISML